MSVNPQEKWLCLACAFVGGYGDAASFVLAKTFTGHITGSLVLAAIAIAAHSWASLAIHLASVLSFLIGVFASVRIERALSARSSTKTLQLVLSMEIALTLLAYFELTLHSALGLEAFVVFMSLALGMQNGALQSAGGISVHTTYLTGMITGLIIAEARKPMQISREPARTFIIQIWAAFVLGGTAGAALALRFKSYSILGAALLFLFIIVCRIRREVR